MKLSKMIIILVFIFYENVQAQNYSYFFGKKYIASIGISLPISEYLNVKEISRIPLMNQIRVEKIVSPKTIIGANFIYNNIPINDEFKDDGMPSNYFISYNGMNRKVNNGKGNISLNNFCITTHVKLYSSSTSIVPVGGFFSFLAGFSLNNVNIKQGYELTYKEYYSNLAKTYVVNKNTKYYFPRFMAGIEFGKTNRFLNDHLLFTYSLSINKYFNKRIDEKLDLQQRFISISQSKIQQNLFLLANINIGHVF